MPCETKRIASDLVLATPDRATFGLVDGVRAPVRPPASPAETSIFRLLSDRPFGPDFSTGRKWHDQPNRFCGKFLRRGGATIASWREILMEPSSPYVF